MSLYDCLQINKLIFKNNKIYSMTNCIQSSHPSSLSCWASWTVSVHTLSQHQECRNAEQFSHPANTYSLKVSSGSPRAISSYGIPLVLSLASLLPLNPMLIMPQPHLSSSRLGKWPLNSLARYASLNQHRQTWQVNPLPTQHLPFYFPLFIIQTNLCMCT